MMDFTLPDVSLRAGDATTVATTVEEAEAAPLCVVDRAYWELARYVPVVVDDAEAEGTVVTLPAVVPRWAEPLRKRHESTRQRRDREDLAAENAQARVDAWRAYHSHPRVRALFIRAALGVLADEEMEAREEVDFIRDFSEVADVARRGYVEPDEAVEASARLRALEGGKDPGEAVAMLRLRRRKAAIELTLVQHFVFHTLGRERLVATPAGANLVRAQEMLRTLVV